jgi:hypothetical protein
MRTNRSKAVRGVVALCAAGAFLLWSFMNALGVFGAPTAQQTSSAAAYQYAFLIKVTGSGSIAAPGGNVNFDISAKNDSGVTTGSCSVSEPRTKTKIKCLDVTSLQFAELAGGRELAVIEGTATISGVTTAYTISVTDAGNPGVGNDTFSVSTSSGYERSGVLTDGNLQIQTQGL